MSKTTIYKSFLITPERGKWKVLDITGRVFGTFESYRDAHNAIDAFIQKRWKRNPVKLEPFHSGKRPGYQNINRAFLKKLGLTGAKLDRVIARQLNGATLKDAYYAEIKREPFEQMKLFNPSNHHRVSRPLFPERTFDIKVYSKAYGGPRESHIVKAGTPADAAKKLGIGPYLPVRPEGKNIWRGESEAGIFWIYEIEENPPHGAETEIYGSIKEIVAVKGPGHKCDAACRRAGHTYIHKFTKRAGVYGLPDGSLKIHS